MKGVVCHFCTERARHTYDRVPFCATHLTWLYLSLHLDFHD